MTAKTGVQRVTSVLTDQMPKLNELCDQVAAQAGASVLRAASVITNLSSQFTELDAAVTQLEDMLNQATNGGPVEEPDYSAPQPAPSENPNGESLGVKLGLVPGGR